MIGRERALADLREALDRSSRCLVTVVGPPGVGKTRLALHAAYEQASGDAGEVAFVDLAPIRQPELLATAIAEALEIADPGSSPTLGHLAGVIGGRPLLLVLDNVEHLAGVAEQLGSIDDRCPRLRLLVTSRTPLGLPREHVLRLPPLGLPDLHAAMAVGEVAESPAVALFLARAAVTVPGHAVPEASLLDVAEICVRLDGLPLAIELAAPRLNVLSPAALRERLEHPLDILGGRPADGVGRHDTLRDAIKTSYTLLSPPERALLCRLAVFAGGFSAEAAEAVAGDCRVGAGGRVVGVGGDAGSTDGQIGAPVSVLDGLAALVDHNLLVAVSLSTGERQLRMLETIREFGLEVLAASGEEAWARRRHADYYVDLAERAEIGICGPEQRIWLDRLEGERGNLRAALAWSWSEPDPSERGRGERVELGLRLAAALRRFWEMRGHLGEGRAALTRLLALAPSERTRARLKAVAAAAANVAGQADFAAMLPLTEAAIELARELNDRPILGFALAMRAVPMLVAGEYAGASTLLEEAEAQCRAADDPLNLALTTGWRAELARMQGDLETAIARYETSWALFRQEGNLWGIAYIPFLMAILELERGNSARTVRLVRESLTLRWSLRDTFGVPQCLEMLARAYLAEAGPGGPGPAVRAARLLGAADALRERVGLKFQVHLQAAHDQTLALAHDSLGPERFAAAWAAGRALPIERAVEEALSDAPNGADAGIPPVPVARLTRREEEVVALLAAGFSNREIAERLVITTGTAGLHVKHVLRKLGLRTRAQVAAWAVRRTASAG